MSVKTVVDKRGREWELFEDMAYFNLYCVRPVGEREFNSASSFHFVLLEEAEDFIELLAKSS